MKFPFAEDRELDYDWACGRIGIKEITKLHWLVGEKNHF